MQRKIFVKSKIVFGVDLQWVEWWFWSAQRKFHFFTRDRLTKFWNTPHCSQTTLQLVDNLWVLCTLKGVSNGCNAVTGLFPFPVGIGQTYGWWGGTLKRPHFIELGNGSSPWNNLRVAVIVSNDRLVWCFLQDIPKLQTVPRKWCMLRLSSSSEKKRQVYDFDTVRQTTWRIVSRSRKLNRKKSITKIVLE